MPRKPRFFIPDIPVHAIARGNNKESVFIDEDDKNKYLEYLLESSLRYEVSVHAYVLMDNHIHLLISCPIAENFSKFMQHIGRRYVPYFNRKYSKTGTLWEGRFKASLVDDERYLLTCYQYIELNPVRAFLVDEPCDYQWSSYHVNALGAESEIIKPHPIYLKIANTTQKRLLHYQDLLNQPQSEQIIKEVRSSVQTGTPLGTEKFKNEIEQRLSCSIGKMKRGRPRKKGTDPF